MPKGYVVFIRSLEGFIDRCTIVDDEYVAISICEKVKGTWYAKCVAPTIH